MNFVLCCTFGTFVIFVLFWREKVMDQSQQMKHLLSSCRISRALRKRSTQKGCVWCPAPQTVCPNTLQKDIESQVVLHAAASNGFLSMGRGQHCDSTAALWCKVACDKTKDAMLGTRTHVVQMDPFLQRYLWSLKGWWEQGRNRRWQCPQRSQPNLCLYFQCN